VSRWGVRLVMLLLGLVQALSMAWPWAGDWYGKSSGILQCLSLAAFAWFLDRTDKAKEAFVRSWFFACAWLLGATWWLYVSLHTYGELAWPIAFFAVWILSALLALWYGLAGWGFHLLRNAHTGRTAKASYFAACWLAAELARGQILTGFPWAAGGYAHVDSVLRLWAPWVGVYGLSAASAWAVMWLVGRRPLRVIRYEKFELALVMLILMFIGFAGWTSALYAPDRNAHRPLDISLVQGNVAQDVKFASGAQQALLDYQHDLLNNDADLMVLPETAIAFFPHQLPSGYWQGLQQSYSKGSHSALVGVPLVRADGQSYTNSVQGFLPQGQQYRYDKHHLVPFGEFVPPLFQWFIDLMHIPLGSFARGDLAQASLAIHGERLAPNICFEDLFGEELAKSFVTPESAPTILVNVSNLAWFGQTVALEQHLNIARMRTLELQRPMLRATNTGVTAYIDEQGEVIARLPVNERGILKVRAWGVDTPISPYAQWTCAWGLWPLWGLAGLIILMGSVKSYRYKHRRYRFGT
jgi:apolipoprotein N-acyltransferase